MGRCQESTQVVSLNLKSSNLEFMFLTFSQPFALLIKDNWSGLQLHTEEINEQKKDTAAKLMNSTSQIPSAQITEGFYKEFVSTSGVRPEIRFWCKLLSDTYAVSLGITFLGIKIDA